MTTTVSIDWVTRTSEPDWRQQLPKHRSAQTYREKQRTIKSRIQDRGEIVHRWPYHSTRWYTRRALLLYRLVWIWLKERYRRARSQNFAAFPGCKLVTNTKKTVHRGRNGNNRTYVGQASRPNIERQTAKRTQQRNQPLLRSHWAIETIEKRSHKRLV